MSLAMDVCKPVDSLDADASRLRETATQGHSKRSATAAPCSGEAVAVGRSKARRPQQDRQAMQSNIIWNNIRGLIDELTHSLLHRQPESPRDFLRNKLSCGQSNVSPNHCDEEMP